jgi:predicted nucleic acid-binding protein
MAACLPAIASTGMKRMKGKTFVDTNLLIYFVSNDLARKQRVHELLLHNPSIVVSTQVINEFVAVSLKKNINPPEETFRYAAEFMELFELLPVDAATILRSFDLMRIGNYSSWDSLIIAAALQANAKTLYTEDLHHGQIIEGNLTILNPFKETSRN